jgi:hypothetical protein
VTGTTGTGQLTVNFFPTTSGVFDPSHNGMTDAFVTKMNINTSTLVYSTFVGGGKDDVSKDIAVDSAGNVYITGFTESNLLFDSFPTTQGSFDTTHNGSQDVFVTKLNANGTALQYSTLLGGNSTDFGRGIVVDSIGNAYVTGETSSTQQPFPVTAGAYDPTYNGGLTDGFVIKLNPSGSDLLFSTYLGGSLQESLSSIVLDDIGNVIIGGSTTSSDFPISPNAFSSQHLGGYDGFITKLNAVGTNVTYSSYFNGSNSDFLYDVFVVNASMIYFAGVTSGSTGITYPVTPNSYDPSYNGSIDSFLTKFELPAETSNTPYDFDGDSKTDISIFRPAPGEWWYLRSSDNGNQAFQFGASSDIIVPGDYTGDGKTDIAFFRPSLGEWFVLRSEDSSFYSFPFGAAGDIPAPGDFDGDGKTDAAVFRPSNATWYISNSTGGTTITGFGLNGDKPVVKDYDGDGRDDIAIYRPSNSQWWLNRSSAGVTAFQFGQAGDKTVAGDYTGDGKADVAFWRPSNGSWFIIRSEDSSFYSFPFGATGDIPSPGDYDGDGKFDAAVFRPTNTTWYVNGSTSGTQITGFGLSTDKPVPSAYVYQ